MSLIDPGRGTGSGFPGKGARPDLAELGPARDPRICWGPHVNSEAARTHALRHGVRAWACRRLPSRRRPDDRHPTVTQRSWRGSFCPERRHLLIEKPMADNAAEAAELVELAAQGHLIRRFGHVERFNPVFATWNRWRATRGSSSATGCRRIQSGSTDIGRGAQPDDPRPDVILCLREIAGGERRRRRHLPC